MNNMKQIFFAVIIAAILIVLIGTQTSDKKQANLDNVSMLYSTGPHAYHAWAMYGEEKGIFAKHGIKLNVIGGGMGANKTNLAVAKNEATISVADFAATVSVNGKLKKSGVKSIFVLDDQGNDILISKQKVADISQLASLSLATNPNSTSAKLLKIVTDIKINFVNIPIDFKELAFKEGQVEAFTTFDIKALPTLVVQLGIPRDQINIFPLVGSNKWSIGLVVSANTEWLSNNPQVAKRLVAAIKESVEKCTANRDACLASLQTYGGDKIMLDVEKYRMDLWADTYVWTANTKANGLNTNKNKDLEIYIPKINNALGLKNMPVMSYYEFIE